MGKAFDCIHVGPGMAYFPAVSLGFKENIVANFGSTPMRYPVPGFEPIQQAPFRDLAKAEKLIIWLSQLLRLFEHKDEVSYKWIQIRYEMIYMNKHLFN